jgi:hypothetical protein
MLHKEFVTFSEHLLAYFCKVNKDSEFSNQSAFFFSDVLDVQASIKYNSGAQAGVSNN